MDKIEYYKDDPNYGWKLHISFDGNNLQKVKIIELYLKLLYLKYKVNYKIGHSGQDGKDATIYCGSKRNADIIANLLNVNIGYLLLNPNGETLQDDISFNDKIMGRFTLGRDHPANNGRGKFLQYGGRGISYIDNDVQQYAFGKLKQDEKQKLIDIAHKNADIALKDEFGEYYTGRKKRSTKPKPKRKIIKNVKKK